MWLEVARDEYSGAALHVEILLLQKRKKKDAVHTDTYWLLKVRTITDLINPHRVPCIRNTISI